MAIRRPNFSSPGWLCQDFLYYSDPPEELRYVQVKYDQEPYTQVSQTFDYSDPPYTGDEQRGGFIVAQIDYTLLDKLITIDEWSVEWRDEWPLRVGINYILNCLYPPSLGFAVRVDKDAYPFWVSEAFGNLDNSPDSYLISPPPSYENIVIN